VTEAAAEIEVNIEHTLAPVQALDPEGQQVRLGTLWEDEPAILIFIREFG